MVTIESHGRSPFTDNDRLAIRHGFRSLLAEQEDPTYIYSDVGDIPGELSDMEDNGLSTIILTEDENPFSVIVQLEFKTETLPSTLPDTSESLDGQEPATGEGRFLSDLGPEYEALGADVIHQTALMCDLPRDEYDIMEYVLEPGVCDFGWIDGMNVQTYRFEVLPPRAIKEIYADDEIEIAEFLDVPLAESETE